MRHPSKPDFNNPIHAIYTKEGTPCFKFETKDGSVSDHPNSSRKELLKREFGRQDAQITKIQVSCHKDYVKGFKFYFNDETVLEAGKFDG
jgi:hypothetical protein